MEMCAQPLNAASAYRINLLQQACDHYDQAASLIHSAEKSVQFRSRASSFSLYSSSMHSPSESVSSRAWTPETEYSSPTPSVCSSEDLNARLHQSQLSMSTNTRPLPKLARKKVSFEPPLENPPKWEPYVRPDSPTLGFDDEHSTAALSRHRLPDVPTHQKPADNYERYESDDETAVPRPAKPFCNIQPSVDTDDVRLFFLADTSERRYCAHLMGLKSQLSRHRASIDAAIGESASVESQEVDRCMTPINDETHAMDRKTRIERLRRSGWQRKRFDPSRYEALRNAALAELN